MNENGVGAASPRSTWNTPAKDAFVEIDRLPRETRRRAGLQTAPREIPKLLSDSARSATAAPGAAGGPLLAADVNQAIQERPRRDDQRRAAKLRPSSSSRPRTRRPRARIRPARRESTGCSAPLPEPPAPTRRTAACPPAPAATRPPAAAAIEHLELMPVASMARPIRPPSASISLTVAFRGAADGRITRHQRDGVSSQRAESDVQPSLAAAHAASTPACPAPTTITSNSVIKYVDR